MKRTMVLMLVFGTLGLAACGDDTPIAPVMETEDDPQLLILDLSFAGLDALANGFHYEGWAILDGAPVSTGKFNVDSSGGLVTVAGAPIAGGTFETGIDLMSTATIVITIEPSGDTDNIPADTHVLSGTVASGTATLSVGHGAALGDDFLSATGDFILATPTDGAGTAENERSGIWFLSIASGSPMTGLSLPTLPAGWMYEGWAVIGGTPVTTGRFTALDMADLSDPFSGTMGGPPFPGEDFLMNAPTGVTFPTDLRGGTAVISIEPEPDDAPGPFTLKPLVVGIASDAVDHMTYSLANMATGTFPTGTAVIR